MTTYSIYEGKNGTPCFFGLVQNRNPAGQNEISLADGKFLSPHDIASMTGMGGPQEGEAMSKGLHQHCHAMMSETALISLFLAYGMTANPDTQDIN